MALAEDFAPFFQEFAVSATLGGEAVSGIFDGPYASAALNQVTMGAAMLSFTLSTPATDPVGASLVIDATTYLVVGHEPDGTGVSVLRLERTA